MSILHLNCNLQLYIEYRISSIGLDSGLIEKLSELSRVYPAEQIVFDGISLTKFKEEGIKIFDMRQGIDTVSEVA